MVYYSREIPDLDIEANIEELLKQAGGLADSDKKKEFQDSLLRICHYYISRTMWEDQITPSELSKRFGVIQNASKKIEKTIEINGEYVPLEFFSYIKRGLSELGEDANKIHEIIDSVILLGKVSEKVQPIIKEKKNKSSSRHEAKEPFQDFFGDLNGLWMDYFESLPGMSMDSYTGKVTGPYLRFIKCLFQIVLSKLPEPFLKSNPSIKKQLESSDNAIRERFKKTNISKMRRLRNQ